MLSKKIDKEYVNILKRAQENKDVFKDIEQFRERYYDVDEFQDYNLKLSFIEIQALYDQGSFDKCLARISELSNKAEGKPPALLEIIHVKALVNTDRFNDAEKIIRDRLLSENELKPDLKLSFLYYYTLIIENEQYLNSFRPLYDSVKHFFGYKSDQSSLRNQVQELFKIHKAANLDFSRLMAEFYKVDDGRKIDMLTDYIKQHELTYFQDLARDYLPK